MATAVTLDSNFHCDTRTASVFDRITLAPCKKVIDMFRSLSIATAVVMSTLVLSPLALAEESPAFVAQTEARHEAVEQRQEIAAQQQELKTRQAATQQQKHDTQNHS